MPCILTALTTGSLNASVNVNLLQSDLKLLYIHPNYHAYQELEAKISGSLDASLNPFLEASITGSLQASTKIKLNARYCQRIQVAL